VAVVLVGFPARQRQVGNFPQAFSHLALIMAAANITAAS
jgi:GH15 family glucan-1,4-alpha-glucosidase